MSAAARGGIAINNPLHGLPDGFVVGAGLDLQIGKQIQPMRHNRAGWPGWLIHLLQLVGGEVQPGVMAA